MGWAADLEKREGRDMCLGQVKWKESLGQRGADLEKSGRRDPIKCH